MNPCMRSARLFYPTHRSVTPLLVYRAQVSSPMRSPLGDLGELVASRSGRALCLDSQLCGAFHSKELTQLVPWPPLPELLSSDLRTAVDDEACGRKHAVRSTTLHFRGAIGSTTESQTLRLRLTLLREVPGAVVTLVGSERLTPSAVRAPERARPAARIWRDEPRPS